LEKKKKDKNMMISRKGREGPNHEELEERKGSKQKELKQEFEERKKD
jgi:hypothetical protein